MYGTLNENCDDNHVKYLNSILDQKNSVKQRLLLLQGEIEIRDASVFFFYHSSLIERC